MADVIKKATNKFTKGLVMDFSPENTQNEILTHALNATLLTFNGNELSLQNDMGNARVETAFLPEGYMPVGTCEYGGIVYIVSYNPLEDKSQIGCFPSPERNISREELGNDSNITIENSDFQDLVSGSFDGNLSNTTKYVILRNDNLNPGDKFLISSGDSIYQECLEGLKKTQDGVTGLVEHPVIALNVVSIEESGKIVYLNSDLRQYSVAKGDNTTYSYHVLGTKEGGVTNIKSEDLDAYRTTLSSGYNVFRSKTSGKLAILAELITIDSYSVTHSIQPRRDGDGEIIDGYFDVVIHTEVSPEVTEQNYTTVPKLKYYYLDKSQGFIQTGDGKYTLFNNGELNNDFLGLNLQQLYVPTVEGSIDFNYTLGNVGEFNFPKPKTYHGHVSTISLGEFDNVSGYSKFEEGKFHRVHSSQIIDNLSYYERTLNARFYRYQNTDTEYKEYNEATINEAYTYYVQTTAYSYEDAKRNEVAYKGKILYKVSIEPEIAKEEQIVDKDVEKFKNITVETYIEATDEDYESGKDLWKKEGETYSEVATKPDDFYISDGKYFTKEVKKVLVSVGVEVENTNETYYYYPKNKQVYVEATSSDLADYWNFDKYQLTENPPYGCPIVLYARNEEMVYRRATADEIYNSKGLGVQLYYKAEYVNIFASEVENFECVFVSIPMDVYIPKDTFTPNSDYNYISGEEAPDDEIPAGDPITLYDVNDFIPSPEEDYSYNDLKLGNIKIPNVVSVNGLDLPFKYDYTIVPCMNYGKLPHLAVSNTVDFSKLHAFNQSNFNIWKYRIDGNQLRLTFGTEVFDTYENNKVDAVILEFYDLWGFAGSLEITNKKSYTGTFTKILDLNALNSLSTKKISGGGYTYNYARNVNIQEAVHGDPDGGFKFGGKEIVFTGHDSGWRYADGTELGDNNDCGALYSNIIYGVKTYFRRPDGEIYEFIRKDDLFMFTLPIYNDYYYTVDNYNTLENPQLEMFLTYKIVDDGTKIPLNYNEIIGGYCPTDKESVSTYIAGNYDVSESTTLDLIKYYKFKGTSNVNLEVGLKKEYSDFNLRYDPIINSYFTCELKLMSDDSEERVYSVKVGDVYAVDYNKSLNYNNSDSIELPLNSVNRIGFNHTYDNTMAISEKFNDYNFLNSEEVSTIPINYEFVVGYKISITEIRKTQVPATTVCALFHQNNGEYNYNDFNIRKVTSGTSDTYMSDVVYYNEGSTQVEKFGLATQVSDDRNAALPSIFNIKTSLETEATVIDTPGILNTYQLKNVKSKIGKLAFQTPHVHALSDAYKVQIGLLGNVPALNLSGENKVKRCNMVANTELMFEQDSEFLSVVQGNSIASEGSMINSREFTSVDAKQLTVFNRKLLNTMSGVYAYNPDYDFLETYAGDVKVENSNLQFTSNLISTNARFNFPGKTTLNNYIFMGPMCFNNFIDYLSKYSGYELDGIITKDSNKNPVSQLGFMPNYTFCGKSEEPYLISSITYNIPITDDIESDLSYTSSNSIIVKHSDSSLGSSLVTGDLNKKALFGFLKDSNQLVQLDVNNYTLDQDGYLSILNSIPRGNVPFNDTRIPAFSHHTNYLTFDDGIGSTTLKLNLGTYTIYGRGLKGANDSLSTILFVAVPMSTGGGVITRLGIDNTVSSTDPSFTCDISDLKVKAGVGVTYLDANKISVTESTGLSLKMQSFNQLSNLFSGNYSVLSTGLGSTSPQDLRRYWHSSLGGNLSYGLNINGIYQGGNMGGGTLDKPMEYDLSEISELVISRDDPDYYDNVVILLKIKIDYVSGNINITRKISDLSDSIVYFPETSVEEYSTSSNHGGYTVKDTYDDKTIKGTSITLNDLLYNPTGTHRLYIKRDRYTPAPNSGGFVTSGMKSIIAYRSVSEDFEGQKQNILRLFQGPSFLTRLRINTQLQ